MLWHRQAIFESKGDKLSSSTECRIRTQGLRHLFASRLNACWQTDWAIEDQAKIWTRQTVPMISKHSAHSTSLPVGFRTWLWRYTCLLLLISMLWHRQAIFESKGDKLSSSAECRIWTQGLRHLFASRLNACWQTDWAIEDQAKIWTRQPVPMLSKHSAHSTSLPVGFLTWLWRYTWLLLLISMLWHRQAIFESKGDKLSSSAECRIRTQGLRHLFASRRRACWQTDWAIEDQAKTWTRQTVPMISKHSAHSTSLPVGFRTWLWRYTCLLLLISMLWHRQAIFESKGDKLSSSAECRIRTQGLRHLFASRLNACWQTDWAIEDQAKTWTRQTVPMISKHSAHSTSLPAGFLKLIFLHQCRWSFACDKIPKVQIVYHYDIDGHVLVLWSRGLPSSSAWQPRRVTRFPLAPMTLLLWWMIDISMLNNNIYVSLVTLLTFPLHLGQIGLNNAVSVLGWLFFVLTHHYARRLQMS